jgi:PPK2 family polyphosphate:nucleotide phosphotransferase
MGHDKGKHDKKKGNNVRHNHNHHGDNAADGPSVDVAEPEKSVGDGTPEPDYPRYRVEPRELVRLKDIDPDEHENYKDEEETLDELHKQLKRIGKLQERLYAESKQSLLIVLQAMDTGGKDGTIRGVFDGVNPEGCRVWSFKAPTPEELAHDFLWRIHQKTPERGMINIFTRSHYEDVLVVRVHELVPQGVWEKRYDLINNFELLLHENNTTIIKFYLHISKDEQKERLEARRDTPDKQWKFHASDLVERARWDDYMLAYEDAINKCSTEYAPWYLIPANKKWYRNVVIARTIADTLEAMDPRFPSPEEDIDNIVIPD